MATRINATIKYAHSGFEYGGALEASTLRVGRGPKVVTITLEGEGERLRKFNLPIPIEAAVTLGGLVSTIAQGYAATVEAQP
jgi:hypothetical protein